MNQAKVFATPFEKNDSLRLEEKIVGNKRGSKR